MDTTIALDAAARVNALHERACSSLKDAVQYAIQIGDMLSQQKEELPHGSFLKWVEDNLAFSARTAQNYIKIFKHKEELEQLQPGSLSEAHRLIAPEKPEPKPAVQYEEDEDDEPGGIIDADFSIVETENGHEYWPLMEKLKNEMMVAYVKLAAKRDHTTPKALGFMIGNIAEMADRIGKWDPSRLTICPICDGQGQVLDDELGQHTTCSVCINGKLGPYKETSL